MAKKTNTMRQRTHDRFDKTMDGAENMKDRGQEAMTRLKDKTVMIRENIDEGIERNPEKSVLIAAGIGAVIGSVLTAVMMRRR